MKDSKSSEVDLDAKMCEMWDDVEWEEEEERPWEEDSMEGGKTSLI